MISILGVLATFLCVATTTASQPNRYHGGPGLLGRGTIYRSSNEEHSWQPMERQLPAEPMGMKTLHIPESNRTVRYKEPHLCETVPGVKTYSGYIDIADDKHMFFWFFEAREDPENKPVTLWLNGGPGSDSLIGLFLELGPCKILTEDLKVQFNPYSFTNVSNMLFLSQPYGTGFSYEKKAPGSRSAILQTYEPPSFGGVDGRYPVVPEEFLTTDIAAAAAWDVLQTFYQALPQLDPKIKSRLFNLYTESYGGTYGPIFFRYFSTQNALIDESSDCGVRLKMGTLGIGNGAIDFRTQVPFFPEFANFNTYGIKALNETQYDFAKFSCFWKSGCLATIDQCRALNHTTHAGFVLCAQSASLCIQTVESVYYAYSGRGTYDIRANSSDTGGPMFFTQYMNKPEVQNALGVNLNYTESNADVQMAFIATGDMIYRNAMDDLAFLLDSGVRVTLYYGDADYICNWFGGQAISLAVNHTRSKEFANAKYQLMTVDDKAYGEVREYGNFSFFRIFEAGHTVPFYQPIAALAMFDRSINGYDIATGTVKLSEHPDYHANHGMLHATHTEPFVPLQQKTTAGHVKSSSQPQFLRT